VKLFAAIIQSMHWTLLVKLNMVCKIPISDNIKNPRPISLKSSNDNSEEAGQEKLFAVIMRSMGWTLLIKLNIMCQIPIADHIKNPEPISLK
jgi:hypothetical protein